MEVEADLPQIGMEPAAKLSNGDGAEEQPVEGQNGDLKKEIGDDEPLEDIVDGFAIASFLKLSTLLEVEAEARRVAEAEARRKAEAEKAILKPVAKKPRGQRNKENNGGSGAKEAGRSADEGMGIKRPASADTSPLFSPHKHLKLSDPLHEPASNIRFAPPAGSMSSPPAGRPSTHSNPSAATLPGEPRRGPPSGSKDLSINGFVQDSLFAKANSGADNNPFRFLLNLPPGPAGFVQKEEPGPSRSTLLSPQRISTDAPNSSHKRGGKWCAMHVRIAWDIYKREQLNKKGYPPAADGTPRNASRNSTGTRPSTSRLSPLPESRDSKLHRSTSSVKSELDRKEESHLNGSTEAERRLAMSRASIPPRDLLTPSHSAASMGQKASVGGVNPLFGSQNPGLNPFAAFGMLPPGGLDPSTLLLRPPQTGYLPGAQQRQSQDFYNFSRAYPGPRLPHHNPLMPPPPSADPRLLLQPGLPGFPPTSSYAFSMQDRQRLQEAMTASILEKQEDLKRQQLLQQHHHLQQQQQQSQSSSMEGAGPLSGMMERELMERQRLLLSMGATGQLGFPFGFPFPGMSPMMPNPMDSFMGRSGFPPLLPPTTSFNPFGVPVSASTPNMMGKIPTPFSNTLEQLARQKRDPPPQQQHPPVSSDVYFPR